MLKNNVKKDVLKKGICIIFIMGKHGGDTKTFLKTFFGFSFDLATAKYNICLLI
jgi:DNA primase